MRISRKVREEAALRASVAASNPGAGWERTEDLMEALGVSVAAERLYWQAWGRADQLMGIDDCLDPRLDAEAESMLRTGWEPSVLAVARIMPR